MKRAPRGTTGGSCVYCTYSSAYRPLRLTNISFKKDLSSLATPPHKPTPLSILPPLTGVALQCPAMTAISWSRRTTQPPDSTQLTTGLWTSGISPRRHSTVKNATALTTSFYKERKIKGKSRPKLREQLCSIKEMQSHSHWAIRSADLRRFVLDTFFLDNCLLLDMVQPVITQSLNLGISLTVPTRDSRRIFISYWKCQGLRIRFGGWVIGHVSPRPGVQIPSTIYTLHGCGD